MESNGQFSRGKRARVSICKVCRSRVGARAASLKHKSHRSNEESSKRQPGHNRPGRPARCEVISNPLLSMASFEASQRSILESNQISRLTKLAFIFILMTFVASVFGMNVAELARNPPIWVFFLVAIPALGFTITVMDWKSLYQLIHPERHIAPAKYT